MKEKLALALSWWAFMHIVFVAALFASSRFGVTVISNFLYGIYFEAVPYVVEDEFVFNLPLLIWVALYVFTGSPRLLPWRKPSHAAKEGER